MIRLARMTRRVRPALAAGSTVARRRRRDDAHTSKTRQSSTNAALDGPSPEVPGLVFLPAFLNANAHAELLGETGRFHAAIEAAIPAARVHTSSAHNLKAGDGLEKKTDGAGRYRLVHVQDPATERRLSGQAFVDYGSRGHTLTYFIGREQFPSFVSNHLIARIACALGQLAASEANKSSAARTPVPAAGAQWRLSVNAYQSSALPATIEPMPDRDDDDDDDDDAFGWHRDIAANGEVTTITTLLAPARIEFRRAAARADERTTVAVDLTPGSLLAISGEARWDWEHRVVRNDVRGARPPPPPPLDGKFGRFSLVLGWR